MIQAHAVSKFFGEKKAVHRVSFNVESGKTLVLLGTSGSGKTTTLRMVNRLLQPDEGTITLDGTDIRTFDPATLRRGIGYVLQNYGLFPHYTVAENVAVVPKLLKWPAGKIANRVGELLEKLRLPPAQFLSKYPAELSGGQKQRVGLARALAADPPVLLMDEPFGALDTITRLAIRRDFKHLDELRKKTIILVTHDVQEAFELGDRIGLMDNGKIEQLGSPQQLLFQPANDFVRDFLNQRKLQLALETISLKSVWPHLQKAHSRGAATVTSTQSLWDVLQLSSSTVDTPVVLDEDSGEFKEISADEVFALFKQQIAQKHG